MQSEMAAFFVFMAYLLEKRIKMRRYRYSLNEAVNPLDKIQALIDQANSAYEQAIEHQGETEWPLMDKEGTIYGLSGNIRLDKRGYIIIPINGSPYSSYEPVKIRVFTQRGGKIKIIPGDYWDEGWKDAKKILNNIIRDANIGNAHFSEYDPSWEDEGNKSALRGMNKRIGRRADAGMEYLESIIRESVHRALRESANSETCPDCGMPMQREDQDAFGQDYLYHCDKCGVYYTPDMSEWYTEDELRGIGDENRQFDELY